METPKRNEKAVALFKEHLPPHIAELCIKEHEQSCELHGGEEFQDAEVTTCEQAIYAGCFWSTRPDRFIDLQTLYHYVDGNTFRAESYYIAYPENRPEAAISDDPQPATGEVPYEVIDELQEHRKAELAAASNAEDTRDSMHSNEPPKVNTDVVIRDIYKDMHQLFQDAHQQIDRVHHDVVNLRETTASSVLDRMYQVYINHVKGNDSIWNSVMRRNEDGSLSMYTRNQFNSEHTWIMPLLTILVAEHMGVQIGRKLNEFRIAQASIEATIERHNRNYDQFKTGHNLFVSDARAKLQQSTNAALEASATADTTRFLSYIAIVAVVIDIIIHIFNLVN